MAESTNNGVKILEVCKVAPFSDSTTTTTTSPFSLTYFDTYLFAVIPAECLFFYEIANLNPIVFNSVILPKLKHSLSLTLLHYLPLSGHIMWPLDAAKPAIYYFPEDGISVTVAESDADFNHLSGNGIRAAVEFHPLVPQLSISDDKAEVIAIQITLFPSEGISICISVHHAVFDGKSAMLFMKSWAYLCKQLELELGQEQEQNPSLLPELTPCFDRTLIKDPQGLDMAYVKRWMSFTGSDPNTRSLKVISVPEVDSNLVRKTFELTSKDIKKLRDKVLSTLLKGKENGTKQLKELDLHLSTYVITCSHVFVCLLKAKGEDANKTVNIGVISDCRSHLDPPVPVNYFGNCVAMEFVSAKASDFKKEDGISFVAKKLSDLIKGLKYNTPERLEDGFKMKKQTGEKHSLISVAGSNRFDFYGLDFGWGKPKKVEVVSIDRSTGSISMMESREEGHVEVGVVLEKQQMDVFASLFFHDLNT